MYRSLFLGLCVLVAFPMYEARSINYPINVCGAKEYNINTHLCCVDQMYALTNDKQQCCGYKVYLSKLMKCCHKPNGSWVIRKSDSCSAQLPKATSYTSTISPLKT